MKTAPVTVRTPASTSNCGAGFDTLGIALSLYNFVRVQAVDTPGVRYVGDDPMPKRSLEMVAEAAERFWRLHDLDPHGLEFDIWGEVPIARGLGSSATLRAGISAGLNTIHGELLDRPALTAFCCDLDHSPDNSVPLVNGGFCIARVDPETGAYCYGLSHPVSEAVRFVVVSPENRVLTEAARAVLPAELGLADAVRSINSVAAVVSIFASGEYPLLRNAVSDFIHQPYREKLNPFMKETISAGVAAGAWCGWLSGSGSSILCVCPEEATSEVGQAMQGIFEQQRMESRLYFLKADNAGLALV